MEDKTHYIDDKLKPIFIIAKTSCGLHWKVCADFTGDPKYVTCKTCLKSIAA